MNEFLSKLVGSSISDVIRAVGDTLDELFTSDEEREKARTLIKNLEADLKLKMGQMALEYDAEVTKRWLSDNEHPLTRLVRPSIVMWSFGLFSIVILGDGNIGTFKVNPAYIPVLQTILTTVVIAYFGSRGVEKTARYVGSKIKNQFATPKVPDDADLIGRF